MSCTPTPDGWPWLAASVLTLGAGVWLAVRAHRMRRTFRG